MNFICYNLISMKRTIIILTLFLSLLNCANAANVKTVTKDYKVVTKDKFTIAATLEYPKIKEKKDFSTVVLIHALGYDSSWWETLPDALLDRGFAILKIDLRGHGNSVFNSKLVRVSWTSLKNKAFAKYPDDVITVINYVKHENKRTFFNNWAIVGSDIGGSTAILAANKMSDKPKTIVILSPLVSTKGLYIPVQLAELNNIDILSITGTKDIKSKQADEYLKKFAQSTYAEYTSASKSTGMLMLKSDETLAAVIASWINEYLK